MTSRNFTSISVLILLSISMVVLSYVIHQKSLICNFLVFEIDKMVRDQKNALDYLSSNTKDTTAKKQVYVLDSIYKSKVDSSYKFHPYLGSYVLNQNLHIFRELKKMSKSLESKVTKEPADPVFAKLRYNKLEKKYDIKFYDYKHNSEHLCKKVNGKFVPVDAIPVNSPHTYFLKNPVTKEYRSIEFKKFADL